ncbi:MAG TPA: hypothetical protein VK721_08205 [Solirubrobacteraceae bacterium]|jgi:hypothetical protein|nr:hypothetical protein [Solirubrobacteraceae bacterium]
MSEREGRAPHPKGGDPNTKSVSLSLTASEWRELRLRAARDATSVHDIIVRIVRLELEETIRREL